MNQIFLEIGNFQIYWYSVILLIAFSIGIFLVIKEGIKQDISRSFLIDYCFYMVPICLIGARIYYVLFNLDYYSTHIVNIFKVWEGGLAIHGGIIAGIIFTVFYTKKRNVNFLKLTDILSISLILGQAIGRWGNFMNQEAYGPSTTYSILKNSHIPEFIIEGMKIDGVYYQPTFFYESIWCLGGFIILLIIRKILKSKNITLPGLLTSIYFIWYGIGRFFIEGLRQDSLMLVHIKVAQLISLVLVLIGIVLIFVINIKKRVKK